MYGKSGLLPKREGEEELFFCPHLIDSLAHRAPSRGESMSKKCSYFYAEDVGVYASVEAQLLKPHMLKCACQAAHLGHGGRKPHFSLASLRAHCV